MTNAKQKRFHNETAAQQFNGREGETATLFVGLSFYPDVARGGFAPRHLSRSARRGYNPTKL